MKPEHSDAKQQQLKPDRPQEVKNVPHKHWDHVDESAWESFPASDPPAHWAGNDKPPTLNGDEEEEEEEKPETDERV
jgi:hypothetical protein